MRWVVDQLGLRKHFQALVADVWHVQEIEARSQIGELVRAHIIAEHCSLDSLGKFFALGFLLLLFLFLGSG